MKLALENVAAASRIPASFLLAIMLQESNGCVRVPTTYSPGDNIANAGLMQSFNGRATCNGGSRYALAAPCPAAIIQAMIAEGVSSMSVGLGPAMTRLLSLQHTTISQVQIKDDKFVSEVGKDAFHAQMIQPIEPEVDFNLDLDGNADSRVLTTDAAIYYQAARIYNSGSVPADNDLSGPTSANRCYVSDVANRLIGWQGVSKGCTLSI